MSGFQFHGELFEFRTKAQEVLADHGIEWLSDYCSIDLDHYRYGIEVCGIREEAVSVDVERILRKLFPKWKHILRCYWECRDVGWRVDIAKFPREPYEVVPYK